MKSSIRNPLKICATGIYLPGVAPISSATIEQKYQIPRGWAERYSGVLERHWVKEETCTDMGAKALQQALDKAALVYDDLDLIVCASATFDHPIPHNACLIQERMGQHARPIPGFDIDATCLGFVVALDVCSRMLDGKRYKKIAIICSEIASKSIDPSNWETLTLLGDAAVAVIIEFPEVLDATTGGVVAFDLATFPHAARYNLVEAGGAVLPGNLYNGDISKYYFKMEGTKLLRLAMEKGPEFMNRLMEDSNISIEDIDHFVLHQASLAGLTIAQKNMNIPFEKMVFNLPRYGNTLSCSIGLALHELLESGKVQVGEHLLLLGSGAGFSIGGLLIRY